MLEKNSPEVPKFDPDDPSELAVYKSSKCIRNLLERNPGLYPAE
jgi:hypothetical protein